MVLSKVVIFMLVLCGVVNLIVLDIITEGLLPPVVISGSVNRCLVLAIVVTFVGINISVGVLSCLSTNVPLSELDSDARRVLLRVVLSSSVLPVDVSDVDTRWVVAASKVVVKVRLGLTSAVVVPVVVRVALVVGS